MRWALLVLLLGVSPLQAQLPQVGRPAPDFTLELLTGGLLSLSDLAGRPVLLNFLGYN